MKVALGGGKRVGDELLGTILKRGNDNCAGTAGTAARWQCGVTDN